jgi:hypothetical protein
LYQIIPVPRASEKGPDAFMLIDRNGESIRATVWPRDPVLAEKLLKAHNAGHRILLINPTTVLSFEIRLRFVRC